MAYDPNNIFAKILRAEIPCKKVYEDDFALAFYDIQPKAPVHVLIIPKGDYVDYLSFLMDSSEAEKLGFSKAVQEVIEQLDLAQKGYRVISNCGLHGGQEVPHYHIHILGGAHLGPMVCC